MTLKTENQRIRVNQVHSSLYLQGDHSICTLCPKHEIGDVYIFHYLLSCDDLILIIKENSSRNKSNLYKIFFQSD